MYKKHINYYDKDFFYLKLMIFNCFVCFFITKV